MPMPTRQGQDKPSNSAKTMSNTATANLGYSACFVQQLIQLLARKPVPWIILCNLAHGVHGLMDPDVPNHSSHQQPQT
jgi:hypothetical protein